MMKTNIPHPWRIIFELILHLLPIEFMFYVGCMLLECHGFLAFIQKTHFQLVSASTVEPTTEPVSVHNNRLELVQDVHHGLGSSQVDYLLFGTHPIRCDKAKFFGFFFWLPIVSHFIFIWKMTVITAKPCWTFFSFPSVTT
uniref:Uncharacterized protein n=1 Tax=Cacopsylla melanoneura TaxID=428564 RepID=A0A8D8WB82_9HEMI